MAPAVNSFVVVALEVLNGSSSDKIWNKYTTKFPEVLLNSYKIWPFAALVNFYLIPFEFK